MGSLLGVGSHKLPIIDYDFSFGYLSIYLHEPPETARTANKVPLNGPLGLLDHANTEFSMSNNRGTGFETSISNREWHQYQHCWNFFNFVFFRFLLIYYPCRDYARDFLNLHCKVVLVLLLFFSRKNEKGHCPNGDFVARNNHFVTNFQ